MLVIMGTVCVCMREGGGEKRACITDNRKQNSELRGSAGARYMGGWGEELVMEGWRK